MIGSKMFARILTLGAFVGPMMYQGRKVTAWRSTRSFQGAQHSEERVLRAKAKRLRRTAALRRAVDAGGYGLTPFVGQKGYVGNTPQNCDAVQIGATPGFAIHQRQVQA